MIFTGKEYKAIKNIKNMEWTTVISKQKKRSEKEALEKERLLDKSMREISYFLTMLEKMKNVEKKESVSNYLKTFINCLTRGGRQLKSKTRTRVSQILDDMKKVKDTEITEIIPQDLKCLSWDSLTWNQSIAIDIENYHNDNKILAFIGI